MGLDMYLQASKSISGQEYSDDRDRMIYQTITTAIGLGDEVIEKLQRNYGNVSLTVGYWRKAHEIHQWFVDTVQDGVDNCAEYYIPRSTLEQLMESVGVVLADPTKKDEEFPENSESRDWDTWLEDEYRATYENLKLLLSPKFDGWEFYYQSSW